MLVTHHDSHFSGTFLGMSAVAHTRNQDPLAIQIYVQVAAPFTLRVLAPDGAVDETQAAIPAAMSLAKDGGMLPVRFGRTFFPRHGPGCTALTPVTPLLCLHGTHRGQCTFIKVFRPGCAPGALEGCNIPVPQSLKV